MKKITAIIAILLLVFSVPGPQVFAGVPQDIGEGVSADLTAGGAGGGVRFTGATTGTLTFGGGQQDIGVDPSVTTLNDGVGTVDINVDDVDLSGDVGTKALSVGEIKLGCGNGNTTQFNTNAYTDLITVDDLGDSFIGGVLDNSDSTTDISYTAAGTVSVADKFTGDNVDFGADGQLTLDADGNTINTITSSGGDLGTVESNNDTTISSTIGTTSNRLKKLTVGNDNDTTVALGGNSFIDDVTVTAQDFLNINNSGTRLTVTNSVDFAGSNGIITMAYNTGLVSDAGTAITNSTGFANGKLVLVGENAITGDVGSAGAGALAEIESQVGAGDVVYFYNDVYADTFTMTGTGTNFIDDGAGGNRTFTVNTLDFDDDGCVSIKGDATVATAVTNTSGTDKQGYLELGSGGGHNIASVGSASVNQRFRRLDVEGDATIGNTYADDVNVSGGTTTFSGVVDATTLDVETGATLAEFDGAVDVTTITMSGAGKAQFDGQVGGTAVGDLNLTSTGEVEFNADANKFGTVTISGTGTLDVNGTIQGTANFTGDGTIDLVGGKSWSGAIDNTSGADGVGTLNTEGGGTHTISGNVGATNSLKLIKVAPEAGAQVNFSGTVNSEALNFASTNRARLNGDSTIDTTIFTANGELLIGDGVSLTGAVKTDTDDQGTLTFLGDGTMTGQVGESGVELSNVDLGSGAGDGKTVAFQNDLYTDVFLFQDDMTATIADGTAIYATDAAAAISAAAPGEGTLRYLGGSTTQCDLGTAASNIKAVDIQGGILTLGHNIYALTTTVDSGGTGGTLALNGNRQVTGNLTLANSGTLDLGANTLTLAGTAVYTQAAGTTLSLDITSSTVFGNIVATANAVVNATSAVAVTVSGAIANGDTFKVIASGAGAGVLPPGTITDNSTIFSFTGAVDAGKDLILTAVRASDAYSSLAANPNAAAVGNVLDEIASTATGDMATVINEINTLNSTEINSSLEQMEPVVNTGAIQGVLVAMTNGSINSISSHLGAMRGQGTGIATGDIYQDNNIWVKGFGNFAEQKKRKDINGFDLKVLGTALGIDTLVTETVRLGVSFGYAYTNVDGKGTPDNKTDINSMQGTVYGEYEGDNFYFDLMGSFGWNFYKGWRNIAVGNISRKADADYNGQQYSVFGEFGYIFPIEQLDIVPLVSLHYQHLHLDSYTETSAGALNLKIKSQDYDFLQSGVGTMVDYNIEGDNYTIIPEAHFRWFYDFIGDKVETTSTFTGGGASFNTRGFDPDQHSWNFGGGCTFVSNDEFSVEATYDFEMKNKYTGHTGVIVFKMAI